LTASNVDRIDVEPFFWAATLAAPTARTPFGLRFSLPMAIAQRIVLGPLPLTDDGTRAFGNPQVEGLARRIFVVEDKPATAAYPERQPTRMTVTLRDGTRQTLSAERILGESDHPLPDGALEAKFIALVDNAWGCGAAAAWRDLARIDEISDIRQVISRWCAAIASRSAREEIT